jgi:ABC-type lipoprotein release transport system permease subunit
MPITLRVALRNLGRNRKRTALAVGAIFLAQFFVLLMDGYMAGYAEALRNTLTGPMLGHLQVHAPRFREERSMDLAIARSSERLAALRSHPEVVAAFPRLLAPVLAARGEEGFMAIVVGVDPLAERAPGGAMAAGSMKLLAGTDAVGADRDAKGRIPVVVGAALAKRQGIGVGDELALVGQSAEGSMAAELGVVRGIVRANVELVSNLGVLVGLRDAQAAFAMEDQLHEITVRGKDSDRAGELSRELRASPALAGLEILPWRELAPELVEMLGMMDYSTLFLLALVFLAASAGVANTMLMSTFERTRELGMLTALGATPGRLLGMIVAETALLGALGILLGTALGAGVTLALGVHGFDLSLFAGKDVDQLTFGGMNFDFRIFPRVRLAAILQGTLATGVTCLLSCLWPLFYILSLEPTEAMRS